MRKKPNNQNHCNSNNAKQGVAPFWNICAWVIGVILALLAIASPIYHDYYRRIESLSVSVNHLKCYSGDDGLLSLSFRNTGNQDATITFVSITIAPTNGSIYTILPPSNVTNALGTAIFSIPPQCSISVEGDSCYEIPVFTDSLMTIKREISEDRLFPIPSPQIASLYNLFASDTIFNIGVRIVLTDSSGNNHMVRENIAEYSQSSNGSSMRYLKRLPVNVILLPSETSKGIAWRGQMTVGTNPQCLNLN